jgi:uncharacterized membrane protein
MISKKSLLTLVLGVAFALYPLLVYAGIQHLQPRLIAALFLGLALVKLGFLVRDPHTRGNSLWLLLAAALAAGATVWSGTLLGLKFYPILVNGIMLGLFVLSLWRPPTMIERFARLQDPQLPERAIAYTRKVTQVWCGFFVLNGTMAILTLFGSDQLWALYNGLLSYVFMGLLLAGEYCVRRRVMRQHHT